MAGRHSLSTRLTVEDLGDRVWRQLRQTLIPLLAVAAAGGVNGPQLGRDWVSFLAVALGTVVVTVLRALSGLRAEVDAPLKTQTLDRAVAAAAGVLLGLGAGVIEASLSGDWDGLGRALGNLEFWPTVSAVVASVALSLFDSRKLTLPDDGVDPATGSTGPAPGSSAPITGDDGSTYGGPTVTPPSY